MNPVFSHSIRHATPQAQLHFLSGWRRLLCVIAIAVLRLASPIDAAEPSESPTVQNASVKAQLGPDEARFNISAEIKGRGDSREDSVTSTLLFQSLKVTPEAVMQTNTLQANAIRGELREVNLVLNGQGSITQVTGDGLEDWSVRESTPGTRSLVLRFKKSTTPRKQFVGEIRAESRVDPSTRSVSPLTFTLEQPALATGFVRISAEPGIAPQLNAPTGLVPLDPALLPEALRSGTTNAVSAVPLAFRFLGTPYSLPMILKPTDPELDRVVLSGFQLKGDLREDVAAFTLTATARVKNPKGGSLEILSGSAALTELTQGAGWRLRLENGRYIALFDTSGDFPIRLQFHGAIQSTNGWNRVQFQVAPSALQPVQLSGLKPGTQFQFVGAARAERNGETYQSFLPPGGRVDLAWKETKAEAEGALFFAVEQLGQAAVKPGMLRQTTVLQFQITQGELTQTDILIQGSGEITRVQGAAVLSWKTDPIPNSTDRRLRIQFNQPQKESFSVIVQTQTALGNFPASASLMQLTPEGATRVGGHFRILNEGAVKLEILDATGLSQISPTQFPQSENSKALGNPTSSQVFAYRYSGGRYALRFEADNILPEIAASQVTTYHIGETELVIEAEFELEVREAPLREWALRIPRGFAVARLDAVGLADYFVTELPGQTDNQLRVVYATPVDGRQLAQLRLERNSPLGTNTWTLPRLDVEKAKSSRGQIAVSADAGFRATPSFSPGLTEIATAFFPRKTPRLQSAFRLTESNWQARMTVERLPQSIQVDALHLFSVGEGIAYGSSLLNFTINGAPQSSFRIALTNEYFNVEFTGKDVRNWQRVDGGYLVQLHSPVSGAYTLLATYERPFKAQGERLRFTGAQPLDAQSEQGHTVIVSTYQFQVQPTSVSPGLAPLEPGEVPAEYRLFFDAPILAAYRYTSRPFNLQLNLLPLAQSDAVRQVIERASIVTRISKDGQAVTESRYFLKSQNSPTLRVTLPTGAELWTASVNGVDVVPINSGTSKLVPLGNKAEANVVQEIRIKSATRAANPNRIAIEAPVIAAPILLADWRVEGESGQRIQFVRGPILPSNGSSEPSLLQSILQHWNSASMEQTWGRLFTTTAFWLLAILLTRLATPRTTHRFSARHITGGVLAGIAFFLASGFTLELARTFIEPPPLPAVHVEFIASVLPANGAVSALVSNLPLSPSFFSLAWVFWPVWVGAALWISALLRPEGMLKSLLRWFSCLLVIWGILRQSQGAYVLQVLIPISLLLAFAVPSIRRWWTLPNRSATPPSESSTPPPASAAATVATLLVLLGFFCGSPLSAKAQTPAPEGETIPIADSVTIQARASEGFITGSATIRWHANRGELLPILHDPGVLTRLTISTNLARLVQLPIKGRLTQALVAQSTALIEAEVEFQSTLTTKGAERGFALPIHPGLIHRLTFVLPGQDAEVTASRSISTRSTLSKTTGDSTHELVLSPSEDTWVGWKPRARDTRREAAIFYADWHHLLIPTPGAVDGVHQVQIRPAQGELTELTFETTPGLTITDVTSPAVTLWRFDPANNRLRVTLGSAQSRPFNLLILSQTQASSLPYERGIGLLRVNGAVEQSGLLGIGTGTEVQLDSVTGPIASPVNLEDFPKDLLERAAKRIPGLTLRRAFRQDGSVAGPVLKAAAVEADVRVELQQTLSLAEDRTVLVGNLKLAILRAGIFKFSFALPQGLEVESISGPTLSHWTETKSETNRLVNLHLKGRTDGQQTFAVNLVGPGIRSATNWNVPRLAVREASKQTGQLLLAPEQGLRLQIGTREGLTQQDPQQSGIRQKGVLLFRVLQPDWKLTLDLERVDAWTQITSLQSVSIDEARVQTQANLQYEIENAGLKTLRVRLPLEAEGVRFKGDQVADFAPATVQTNAPTRDWEIKLHRRMNGRLLLQVQYTYASPQGATNAPVRGVEALDVNLQRGFLSVQGANRIQIAVDAQPTALQPSDTQAVPRTLFQDLTATQGNEIFRVVDPAFTTLVRIQRHEVARVLPARVERLTLTTIPSHDGALLTRTELVLVPGDKQLLPVTLPSGAEFWSAFVGGNSARTWREGGRILIPLEQHARTGEPVTVEFYFSSPAPRPGTRAENLALACPRFDLPLENIRWHVFLDPKWELKSWKGALQFEESVAASSGSVTDVAAYVRNATFEQARQSKEAAQYLSIANNLLEKGDPENARRAFQNAYGLSQHDLAFNEDARVQLHNLKTQQALVGLNVRQTRVGGDDRGTTNTPAQFRNSLTPSYTQQEARQLIDRNSAEDNAIQMRLVERLIQQQEATTANPTALRASLPELGHRISFSKSLQIDKGNELQLLLQLRPVATTGTPTRWLSLAIVGLVIALIQASRRWIAPVSSQREERA